MGRVVGVNTLKLTGREGVGLAVPAQALEQALNQALQRLAVTPGGQPAPRHARTVCSELLERLATGSSTQGVERALSATFIADAGPESLSALPQDGTDWALSFVKSPADVLAHALALRLRKDLKGVLETRSSTSLCEVVVSEGGSRVLVPLEERPFLGFVWEQGRYKLVEATLAPSSGASFLKPKRRNKRQWTPSLR